MNPFWRAYFSNGLVQPPISEIPEDKNSHTRAQSLLNFTPYKESYSDFNMISWSVWCGKESVLYKMMTLLTLADPRNPNLMDHLWCYVRHQRTSKIFFHDGRVGGGFKYMGVEPKIGGKPNPQNGWWKKFMVWTLFSNGWFGGTKTHYFRKRN